MLLENEICTIRHNWPLRLDFRYYTLIYIYKPEFWFDIILWINDNLNNKWYKKGALNRSLVEAVIAPTTNKLFGLMQNDRPVVLYNEN